MIIHQECYRTKEAALHGLNTNLSRASGGMSDMISGLILTDLNPDQCL